MDIQLIQNLQFYMTDPVPAAVGRVGGTGFLSAAGQQKVVANKSEEKNGLNRITFGSVYEKKKY